MTDGANMFYYTYYKCVQDRSYKTQASYVFDMKGRSNEYPWVTEYSHTAFFLKTDLCSTWDTKKILEKLLFYLIFVIIWTNVREALINMRMNGRILYYCS